MTQLRQRMLEELQRRNYLPTHRASGSLQTALSKVLRNQASAAIQLICRNTSDRELALVNQALESRSTRQGFSGL